MYRPDPQHRNIVSLYKAQGDLPLSPSFVASELNISTADAEARLDDLVRDSVLEFDFAADGELYYQPGSAYPFDEQFANAAATAEPGGWGSTDGGGSDGFATATSRAPRKRARHDGSAQFDGFADAAVATPSRPASSRPQGHTSNRSRPRSTAGMREYIPPSSGRRRSSRKRSSERGRTPQQARRAPQHDSWAEIGPNGCDGSVHAGPGTNTAAASRTAYQQTPAQAPPSDSPWSEHRRHAGLHPRDTTTDLVAMSESSDLPVRKRRHGDPLLASFLSLLFVGSGQLYNGEFAKGVAFFVSFVVLWAFALGWMVHIWAAVDAYQVAQSRLESN